MSAKLWEGCFGLVPNASGEIATYAQAYFFAAGTSTPLVTYADAGLSTPNAHPVAGLASGLFPPIFLPYTDYRVLITDRSGVAIYDRDNIANPAPPSSGGGGGVTVQANQIFRTGYPLFLEQTGTLDGFVRDNARTIGNAVSGASERANADCADLFAFYWNTYPDSICPVSTGRGSTAAGDFAAGKTIQTLDKRGVVAVGLDDMGNSAANRIQLFVNITTSNASATATVNSASGLALGMYVVASTIPAGTTIAGISGTTITLSTGTGVTAGTATAARVSFFSDAQTPGVRGGTATVTVSVNEMPAHSHTGTVNVAGSASVSGNITGVSTFNDYLVQATGTVGTASGGNTAITTIGNITTPNSGAVSGTFSGGGTITGSGTFTTASAGSGLPLSNLQPGILGTWYRKI